MEGTPWLALTSVSVITPPVPPMIRLTRRRLRQYKYFWLTNRGGSMKNILIKSLIVFNDNWCPCYKNLHYSLLALSGAQGASLSVCLSVCPSGTNLSKALNLHLSLMGLSQVSLRLVSGQSHVYLRSLSSYFIGQMEHKILRLVSEETLIIAWSRWQSRGCIINKELQRRRGSVSMTRRQLLIEKWK